MRHENLLLILSIDLIGVHGHRMACLLRRNKFPRSLNPVSFPLQSIYCRPNKNNI